MTITATSHSFAAGDIDYINNLNLVRNDVGSLITDANTNPKGTMASQDSSSVSITGGTLGGISGIGINTAASASYGIRNSYNLAGAIYVQSVRSDGAIQSSVTGGASYYKTSISTSAASFTCSQVSHFDADQGTIGAGSIVTKQTGFLANNTLIGAANNYGFQGEIPSGSQNYNLYMNGTAKNYLNGLLLLGTLTDNGLDKLQVNGGVSSTGRVVSTSPTAGVGYTTGAGGSVTQTPTISSSVTINTVSGRITTVSTSLSANSWTTFTVLNSAVGANDVVVVNLTTYGSGGVTANLQAYVTNKVAGGFEVGLRNLGGSATPTGTFVIDFVVIKGVSS